MTVSTEETDKLRSIWTFSVHQHEGTYAKGGLQTLYQIRNAFNITAASCSKPAIFARAPVCLPYKRKIIKTDYVELSILPSS